MSTVRTGMKTPGKKKTLSNVKGLIVERMVAKKKKPCGCVDKLSGLLQNDFRVSSAYNFRTGESVAIISVRRDKTIRDGKKAPTLFATYCPFCGKKYDIATNDISLRE